MPRSSGAKRGGISRRHATPPVRPASMPMESIRPAALPGARLCRLMAELEAHEHGDGNAARTWLARAAAAPPDPSYVCRRCAAESPAWRTLCPRCRAFDTLEWRSPSRTTIALPDPSPGDLVTGALAPPVAGFAGLPPTPADSPTG